LGVVCLLAALLCPFLPPAHATPVVRYQTDLHGDMVVFGNTMGFDCRPGIPTPVVGSVDTTMCYQNPIFNTPAYINDPSADVFWRCEDSGTVSASASVDMTQARSAAVLQLPAGAIVAYARVYWGSTVREDMSNSSSILIDRPNSGGFSQTVVAAQSDIQAADISFQASADITELVQTEGPGVYRVSGAAGFPKAQLVDRQDPNNYAAWAIVVFYELASEPVRNFSLYDGLTFVSPNVSSSMTLTGFVVPAQGTTTSNLAVLGYKGDFDETGDALMLQGTALTDGQPGSASNFFNSSRTTAGMPVSVMGDLPQMNGTQGSMNYLDLDVVNISSLLTPGSLQATLDMVTGTTVSSDQYFVGAIASSIESTKPIIEGLLTVPAGLSPLPGDMIEYTLTVSNSGDDSGSNVVIQHALPTGLNYVPGSIRITAGPNQGPQTDAAGDDEAEYDAATRTIVVRLGNGANATMGGVIATTDAANVVEYQLQVADTAVGAVATQAFASATPTSQPTAPATTYPSSDGPVPNQPTVITVVPCANNFDCTLTSPVCNLQANPPTCTDACGSDTDCQNTPGGQDVCGTAKTCVQCSAAELSACTASGLGAACLPSGACGCMTDSDCGGRTCNTTTNTCPNPSADLSATISTNSNPADIDNPVNFQVVVSNSGPALAPTGTELQFAVQSGGTLQLVQSQNGWRCSLANGMATCMYYEPITPGASSPAVTLVVSPTVSNSGSFSPSSLTVQATISSNSSTDPNPGNNTVTLAVPLGRYQVAGGGFGCGIAQAGHTAPPGSALAVIFFALFSAGIRRRRAARTSNA
jgi:uncharacterized repeat protein (TIGR01451 family)